MYATCQQLQAQAQAHAAAASGLLGHTELRLHVPPSIAFATRGRLQGLRLQLALLDREFDDLGMCCALLNIISASSLLRICDEPEVLIVILAILADYDTLRALDSDNMSGIPSMSEEEINALPVHKYKMHHQPSVSSPRQVVVCLA